MDKRLFSKKKRIIFGFIAGLLCFGFQTFLYRITGFIMTYSNAIEFVPKMPSIDDKIPLITIFVIPYIISYAYWILTPIAASEVSFKNFLNMVIAYIIASIVAAIIFLIFPTYMDRVAEGIYGREINGFFDWILNIIYESDGKEKAYNLFPSAHCILSTLCMLATFRKKEIPLWYRIISFTLSVLIYLSTLFIKQHYVGDVVFGIIIGIFIWYIVFRFNLGYKILNKPAFYFIRLFNKKNNNIIEEK